MTGQPPESEYLADVLIADVPDYRHLAYRFGANPIEMVIKRGRIVVEKT